MTRRTRVWEFAAELGVTSGVVVAALRARDEWVSSHLSIVPDTVMDDLRRTLQPAAGHTTSAPPDASVDVPPRGAPPRPGVNPFGHLGRPLIPVRRRPGPARVTYQPPYDSGDFDYVDPVEELRHQPVLSTRDVAKLCSVNTGSVRQWVRRGHLDPIGKNGASHIFETIAVLDALATIRARRKQRAQATDPNIRRIAPPGLPNAGQQVSANEVIRMARVHGNLPLNTAAAAAVLGVKPGTLRSWVKRGHISALPTSGPRNLQFGLADLLRSTGHRHL